jgi:hypothetical protein
LISILALSHFWPTLKVRKKMKNSFELIGSPTLYSLIRRGVGFPWTQSMAVGIPADRKLAEKVSNDRTLGLSKLALFISPIWSLFNGNRMIGGGGQRSGQYSAAISYVARIESDEATVGETKN